MSNAAAEKAKVIQQIHKAFAGVKLGQGVSLHETIIIDDYGGMKARQQARAGDEKMDWTKLVDDPELKSVYGIGGISFFDAEGLRFHLPAYMCLALNSQYEDVTEGLIFTLISYDKYNQERFSTLNDQQRGAIIAFLIYLRKFEGNVYAYYEPKITKALAEYWLQT
ncbi:MAG: DUF6714 family protein [Bacteroidota bacterium]